MPADLQRDARILVVDDDQSMLDLISASLDIEGFAVSTARTAKDALRMVHAAPFDLMVTDVFLSNEANGVELVAAAREIRPDLKSLFVSGHSEPVGNRPSLDDFVAKPFWPRELVGCVYELLGKVQELARYRSEFFGRLRQILGDRPDVRVVGDRFVFQSEVLFDPGNADLGDPAKQRLDPVIAALKQIAGEIPKDIDWVLRVDGHTDKRPIKNDQFPSNWELSTARAISVVRYMIAQGIPPDRLAAAGFADTEPLDTGNTPDAYARNRRIELKLTEH